MAEVLRYPYEAITKSTDYLQITIKNYEAGDMLTTPSAVPTNAADVSTTSSANLYKQTLVNDGGIILLPMPSNIQDSNSVSYEEGSLDAFSAIGVESAQKMMMQDFSKPGGVAKVLGNIADTSVDAIKNLQDAGIKEIMLKALASQAVSVFGGNVTVNQILARSEGKSLNPNMELLFNGVTLRSFRFSFKMTPRNQNESTQVKKIIRSFKRNMAPKSDGAFLIAPHVFQLEYRRGGGSHPFLHRFKPCALSDMSVNYTGDNVYAVYSDSTPVSIIMDLTFKELVPVYEEDYNVEQGGQILETDGSVGY
jgi:hypothetical protein